jgi:hypothetical protein
MLIRLILMFLAALMSAATSSRAEHAAVLSIAEENDMFSYFGGNKDRHYTQGAKVSFFGGPTNWAGAAAWWNGVLPAIGFDRSQALTRVGLALGQNLYTPDDISRYNPDPLDQPYAAWLYLGASFQRRTLGDQRVPVFEHFEINLGIVGPYALGKPAQTFVHRSLTSSPRPLGWKYQLETEPGLHLKYDRAWRLAPPGEARRYLDIVPHVGIHLGNIKTAGAAGAMLRAGWNLPDDFGLTRIEATKGISTGFASTAPAHSVYVFAAADGEVVGQNLFLDGNTGRSSRSVKREPLVGEFSWGFAARLARHFEITFTRVLRTETFVSQRGRDYYGALSFQAIFDF